ncbi:MAG: hypothetical protein BEU04_03645 [Marine Group III euryarchaeote CG-Bathy1]|uniref:DNA replication complex GINS family protein n=1 Tax=Marine Group III euryarchaeote CG-Bathy1 TaxID=1889001 RepID=A0A1J5SYK0_9ARCH|nr:MAG: hypothetical protein BEU04_03645 [Marine Group III euryarchaeote CG-Bathy1]
MAKKELTLRELKVQAISERKEGRLIELPEKFFEKLHNLEKMLLELLEEHGNDAERKDRVNDDLRKLMDLKIDLIKRREMKLADLAVEIVNKQNPGENAVDDSEKEFLKEMCKIIEKHRNEMIRNELSVEKEKVVEEVEEKVEEVEEKVEEVEEKVEEVKEEVEDYLLVKVTDSIPTFIGMDSKSYTLEKNDILHLPKYNARLLMDAGKIERME